MRKIVYILLIIILMFQTCIIKKIDPEDKTNFLQSYADVKDKVTAEYTLKELEVSLDGNPDEWNEDYLITTDIKDEDYDANDDILKLFLAAKDNNLYGLVKVRGEGEIKKFHIFINQDANNATGFTGAVSGVEYMIQGASIFQFTGTKPNQWSWKNIGKLEAAVMDDNIEFKLPFETFGITPTSILGITVAKFNNKLTDIVDKAPEDKAAIIAFKLAGSSVVVKTDEKKSVSGQEPLKLYNKPIVIDGNTDDWTDNEIVLTDNRDDNLKPEQDIINVSLSNNENNLYGIVNFRGRTEIKAFHIFLDSDGTANTGYAGAVKGVEYMVQGVNIFQWTGKKSNEWSWKIIGQIQYAVNGNNLEFLLNLKDYNIAVPSDIGIVIAKFNDKLTDVIDRTPEKGSKLISLNSGKSIESKEGSKILILEDSKWKKIDGNISDWDDVKTLIEDRSGDNSEDNKDFIEAKVAFSKSKLYLYVKNQTGFDNGKFAIYFNTDLDNNTGYSGPNPSLVGMDYNIISGILYKFTGKNKSDWSWEQKEGIIFKIKDNIFEGKIPISLLNLKENSKFSIAFQHFKNDWSPSADIMPDGYSKKYQLPSEFTVKVKEIKPAKKRAKKDILNIDNYVCYYGKKDIEKLKHFDMVIIHPTGGYTKDDIKELKEWGVITIGYITIGEDDELHKGNGKGPGGKASWYVDVNNDNKPDMNPNWGSYYVNAGDPEWQKFIIQNKMKHVIEELGFDGIFMDTLDSAELYYHTHQGMIDIVRKMKEAYPDKHLIANRGFIILREIAPYISGVMFECFTSSHEGGELSDSEKEFTRSVAVNTIQPALGINKFLVVTLDYSDPDDYQLIKKDYFRSQAFGFVPYVATRALDKIFFHDIPEFDKNELEKERKKVYNITIKNQTYKKDNKAHYKNGAKITVDGSFLAYNETPLNDGVIDMNGVHWTKQSWASFDDISVDHWVEITFPEQTDIKKIKIYWAIDSSKVMYSQKIIVQKYENDKWIEVKSFDIQETNDYSELDVSVTTDTLRLFQPKKFGPLDRPGIMWIREIEVY